MLLLLVTIGFSIKKLIDRIAIVAEWLVLTQKEMQLVQILAPILKQVNMEVPLVKPLKKSLYLIALYSLPATQRIVLIHLKTVNPKIAELNLNKIGLFVKNPLKDYQPPPKKILKNFARLKNVQNCTHRKKAEL